jgi:hypothetical protein
MLLNNEAPGCGDTQALRLTMIFRLVASCSSLTGIPPLSFVTL